MLFSVNEEQKLRVTFNVFICPFQLFPVFSLSRQMRQVCVRMYAFHWMVSIDSFACETFKEPRLESPLCRLAISSDSNCSVFNRRGTIIRGTHRVGFNL